MKISITYRLFLAILAATLLAVLSMLFIMQWSIDRGFLGFVHSMEQRRLARLSEQLAESYAEHGNWDFLRRDPSLWNRLVAMSGTEEEGFPKGPGSPPFPGDGPPGGEGPPPSGPLTPPPLPPRFHIPVFLLDAAKKPLIGPGDIPSDAVLQPIRCRQQIVGYVGLLQHRNLADIRRFQFVREQRSALFLVAMALLLLTAALSLLLANRLVRPIRALAGAARELAAGRYGTRVPVASSDELGRLAGDFNYLALTLEKNEEARRQWVADISHELRTPLAVLRGEIEALQDGIRELNPDSIHSLHGEVMRLSRLVDDLYQLSLSDLGALTYRKEELDMAGPLVEALSPYIQEFSRKGIKVSEDIPRGRHMMFGDHERLRQLFANLFDNTLKYTDEGGKLVISCDRGDGTVIIDIQDSAPGVPSGDLARLFDRLYRVETSRSRSAGGAGLGLAICRNIAEAHAGAISARPSSLGGLWIRVTLPLMENTQ
ncbi:MAG TPA: ATP-binding protein [Geobacteraceae bacterium]|nr:ATP-binding protein [Geobacteraceae bacterium]